MGLIIDEIIDLFLNLYKPPTLTMALDLTQPLRELSARKLPGWLKCGRCGKLTTSLPTCESIVDMSYPYRPPRTATKIALFFYFCLSSVSRLSR
jgi:hypothetical protein